MTSPDSPDSSNSSDSKPARGGKPAQGGQMPEETSWDRTKANIRTIGGALLLAIFIRVVIFEPFEIEGPSMEPTLLNGDKVVVAKYRYGLSLPFMDEALTSWGVPNYGDVIIVMGPLDGVPIVKRVAGVQGDTIEIRDHRVYRNGEVLDSTDLGPCSALDPNMDDSPSDCFEEGVAGDTYLTSREAFQPSEDRPPTEIPPGHIYVLGDHRDKSNDSRFFGPVAISRIKGQALAMYWSSDMSRRDAAWKLFEGVRWDRIFDAIR